MKQLNEFNTLEEAQAYTYTTERMISNAMIFAMLGQYNSMNSLINSTDNIATSFLYALNGGVDEYNLMNTHPIGKLQQTSLNYLVEEGIVTQEFATSAIDYANNKIEQPYINKTLREFNVANGIYTQKEVIGFNQGNSIRITLIDTLPESCTLMTWEKSDDFDYQNFGKHCPVYENQNTYKIRTDNKKPDGKLFVRIPFENFNFTVESI